MASLPYPRGPLVYPPTEATERAEVSGGEEPPQMHTDEHRLGVPAGGVGMAGCHTLLQKLPQIALPRNNNKIATLQQQYCHATTTILPRYNNKIATLR